MHEAPIGLIGEQCLAVRMIHGKPEVRQVEIMRSTETMYCDDFEVRYSRKSHQETGVRGEDAWKLYHRKSDEAKALQAQADAEASPQ